MADGELDQIGEDDDGGYEPGRTGRGSCEGGRTGRGTFESKRTGRGNSDTLAEVRSELVDVEAHTRGNN